MSDIMRRLKKLEKRVADNPLHEGSAAKSPISGKRSAPRSGYVTWNSSRTALLLVMGIGLGVLGYLAGIRSNRGEGESRESTWREDQSALDHGLSQSSPVVNEGMGMEVAEASNTGSDLTTLVFEAEPILPSKTPRRTATRFRLVRKAERLCLVRTGRRQGSIRERR